MLSYPPIITGDTTLIVWYLLSWIVVSSTRSGSRREPPSRLRRAARGESGRRVVDGPARDAAEGDAPRRKRAPPGRPGRRQEPGRVAPRGLLLGRSNPRRTAPRFTPGVGRHGRHCRPALRIAPGRLRAVSWRAVERLRACQEPRASRGRRYSTVYRKRSPSAQCA